MKKNIFKGVSWEETQKNNTLEKYQEERRKEDGTEKKGNR